MGLDKTRRPENESYEDKKRMPPSEVMVTFERRESDPTIEHSEEHPVEPPLIIGAPYALPPSVFELQRSAHIGDSVNIILSGAG